MHFYQVKIIKHLSERNFFWLAVIWTVLITVLSLVSLNSVPNINVVGNDKFIHFLFYFILVILWGLAIKQICSNSRRLLLVAVFAVNYGIIIEVLQSVLTITRQADFYDILANTAGVIIGTVILFFCEK